MEAPKCLPISFGEPAAVRAEDPATQAVWEGSQQRAELPKPGGGVRVARIAKALLSPEESLGLLETVRGLAFTEGGGSSSSSTSSVEIMEAGQYLGKAISSTLRPFVDGRLLPYARWSLGCPGAVVCHAAVRRHCPNQDADTPAPLAADRGSFGTALLALNPEDARGGVFLQATSRADSPGFVPLDCGDLLLHQHDLPRGVRVSDGEWYCVEFHLKDSILACLTSTSPWYSALAERGDADAQVGLALSLLEGGQDGGAARESAVRWLKAAAEQGHPEAQERLGSLCGAGEGGTAADEEKAVDWWHKAALQGRRAAQRLLAEALLRGRGAARNAAEALRWLRRSAEQGEVEAMYLLVVAYSAGTSGCSPDAAQALAWCQRGARAGHVELQHRLASHLLAGQGLPQDVKQAAHWLERAAERGHSRAKCNLGVLLVQGLEGLDRSPARARALFEQAAAASDAEAQYNLALLLRQGAEGVARDTAAALSWCRLAASQGHSRATSLLEDLEKASFVPANCSKPPNGQPVVSLDESHRARLDKLLSELNAMRGEAEEGPVQELLSVLHCLEGASRGQGTSCEPLDGKADVAPARPRQAEPQEVVAEPPKPAALATSRNEDSAVEEAAEPEGAAASPAASGEDAASRAIAAAGRDGAEAGDRGAAPLAEGTAAEVPPVAPEAASRPAVELLAQVGAPSTGGDAVPTPADAPATDQVPAPHPSSPERTSVRQRAVPRANARATGELQRALTAGEPVLVADAMPHLSGKRVVEFMPKLVNAAGKEQITYEIQGPGDELQVRQAPFALYVQGLQRSKPGGAYLTVSDRALRHPELAEFLEPPSCFGPDRTADLPSELRPEGAPWLLVGGRGAGSRFHRSPATTCTWVLLVLGKVCWHLLPPDAEDEPALLASEEWEVEQGIGEVLLLPPGWHCQALFEDRSLAVLGQQLPEASQASAAAEATRRFGLPAEQPARCPSEIFSLVAEQARQRGLGDLDSGFRSLLRSSARPELKPPPSPQRRNGGAP